MKLITALLAACLFSACSNIPSHTAQTPQQAVFAAKSAYGVALTAAVAYKRLPGCAVAKPPCSSPSVVAQLQKADTVASTALDAAETVVRTPGFGQNVVSSAVTAATSALSAFVSITSTLGVK